MPLRRVNETGVLILLCGPTTLGKTTQTYPNILNHNKMFVGGEITLAPTSPQSLGNAGVSTAISDGRELTSSNNSIHIY
jgi:hypothetical protein